jgi:hypothetical protein
MSPRATGKTQPWDFSVSTPEKSQSRAPRCRLGGQILILAIRQMPGKQY